ncbi:PREDICTED: mucin-13 [Nestor notabilis]|uniref:mucin-13 n=1 Tax=Nestor notabilis TaxID=176057 RepID=UPI0005239019|nr:PREDICTED: mucin-13 [Nestor notabilis]
MTKLALGEKKRCAEPAQRSDKENLQEEGKSSGERGCQRRARDFCNPDPCGKKTARCVALYSSFTCQCQYGFYYSNGNCHAAKIFPGVITLKKPYSSSVQIINSPEYEEVFKNITTLFKDILKDLDGFADTVIVQIHSNVTNETATDIISAVRAAIQNLAYVSDYRATTYCAAFNCDDQTTTCKEAEYPECVCKSGFTKTEWDERSCSGCSESCSSEHGKYCEIVGAVPTCKCMPNYENKTGNCVPCPVGYSGDNCENNTELILITVGTVFGAIILSLLIAVSIVSVRNKHRQDPEQKRLIKTGYSNSNTYADRQNTMFPRVQTTSGHVNPGYQPNNPYEKHSTNKGQFPERDYDDLYEASQGHGGFRMQSKY